MGALRNKLPLKEMGISLFLCVVLISGFLLLDFRHFKYALLIPGLFLGGYLYLYSFRYFMGLTVFFAPLSINLADIGRGVGVSLPLEPMILGVFLGALAISFRKKIFSLKFFLHPVSIIVLLQLVWYFGTSLSSTHHLVSVKSFISRFIYVFVFYFVFSGFWTRKKEIYQFIGLYLAGFIPVIIYALVGMGRYGFSQAYSPAMGQPFFSDHTIFGAALAMLIPPLWMLSGRKQLDIPKGIRLIGRMALILVIFAVVFSYSRAAWLSLFIALGIYWAFRLRLGPGFVLASITLVVAGVLFFKGPIYESMKNREKIDNSTLIGHASTVTDLERDQSNLERINRWNCAMRMYRERPFWGYGPATYEGAYGKFQVTSELTRISTYDGDRGDAHSDYLTALSEQGMPGFLMLIALYSSLIFYGLRLAFRAKEEPIRRLSLGIVLGLITLIAHVAVNTFMDIDKSAVLFWAFAGILVQLDLNYFNEGENGGVPGMREG